MKCQDELPLQQLGAFMNYLHVPHRVGREIKHLQLPHNVLSWIELNFLVTEKN